MFGYVRPCCPELKCRDFDLYRATYCGLCRCLRRQYGFAASMFLNFDFTFLALLLWEPEDRFVPCPGRCHVNPLRRLPMCPDSGALELAAGESLILVWWKLRDSVHDEGFWKGLAARVLSWLLKPAYKKAVRRCPRFDGTVRDCLEELAALEKENCPLLDRTADTFARLLQSAAPQEGNRGRVLSQLLYHLGRWIYLADARDDLEEDKLAGRYNPVAARYGPGGDDGALGMTMNLSLEQMGAALQLGDFGCRRPLLENIVYLGLPLVEQAVFDGSWRELKKQKIWRNIT